MGLILVERVNPPTTKLNIPFRAQWPVSTLHIKHGQLSQLQQIKNGMIDTQQ